MEKFQRLWLLAAWVTLLVGLWQCYGEWLLSRLRHGT
jgi:hypothetical protein